MMELTRRKLFGLAGASAAVGVAGMAGASAAGSAVSPETGPTASSVAFYGQRQAGITTPAQDRLHLAAFDLTSTDRSDLVALLRAWTGAAARLTSGRDIGGGAVTGDPEAPPDDTGEAQGLPASRLTLTVGFGAGMFTRVPGLAASRPAGLVDLPVFAGDALEPARCGGDLVVQACADDPQVAVHAVRNLVRIAHGTAAVRWSQLGFGRTSSTTTAQATPRNLFGFKDGTDNTVADSHLWVQPGDGADWLTGGSYLVHRRIRMLIETWDRSALTEQEQTIGRRKGTGAPLGTGAERDPVVPAALPATSHVRLAHPASNGGATMLRRGYSFVDGSDGLGHLDAGLAFLAYVRDPRTGYIPVQSRLSGSDAMNEYVRHVGSGLWAVPPGVRPGGFWGDTLLA